MVVTSGGSDERPTTQVYRMIKQCLGLLLMSHWVLLKLPSSWDEAVIVRLCTRLKREPDLMALQHGAVRMPIRPSLLS